VLEFKEMDGKTAKNTEVWNFVCDTARECKELQALHKVGQAHLRK
jgi:hypothetical protein